MPEVLERLKNGIRRFQLEVYPQQAEAYQKAMLVPQTPQALVITCADSRIHPEVVTQAEPGDLFVTRNIGNLVPTYGEMVGGVSAVLEYAVSALKVKHIAVCGHTDCGAMKALLNPASVEGMPAVKLWLKNAHAALSVAQAIQPEAIADETFLRLVTEQNVLLQMSHLQTHPSVAEAVKRGELTISGWIYDIAQGDVHVCEEGGSTFRAI